jgi:hypothetical protein
VLSIIQIVVFENIKIPPKILFQKSHFKVTIFFPKFFKFQNITFENEQYFETICFTSLNFVKTKKYHFETYISKLLFLDLDSEISWNNFINLKNLRSNKEDLKEQYSKWIERQKERPKTTLQTLTAQTKSTASKRENQNKSYTYAKS